MQKIQLNALIIIGMMVVIFSCTHTSHESEQLTTLKFQVKSVHDSAMAKMDDIMAVEKQLKTQQANEALDTVLSIQIGAAIADLEAAHKGMMTWMHEFSSNYQAGILMGEMSEMSHGEAPATTSSEELTEEKLMEGLTAELAKIEKVGEDIDQAIARGEQLLEQL